MRYDRAFAIATSDTDNLPQGLCEAIYVSGAGDVVAILPDGAVTFKAVPVGTILPINASRVNQTNTTATQLVALY